VNDYPLALLLTALVFVLTTYWYGRSRYASIYHPVTMYLAFHGFVFVIRPIYTYLAGDHFIYLNFGFFPSESTKLTALAIANVGLLAFVLACVKTGSAPLAFKQDARDARSRAHLIQPFLLVALILGPLAIYSLISTGESWSTMRFDRATGTTINTAANGWVSDAQQMLVPLAAVFAWLLRFRLLGLLPLIAFVLARAGTGGRGPVVVVCVGAGLLWLFDRRRRWPTGRMLVLAVLLLLAFHAVGADRGASIRTTLYGEQTIDFGSDPRNSGLLSGMDFANLEFLEWIVDTVPDKTGTYGYFVDNLQVFTEPIPRKLWPGKPIGAPIKLLDFSSQKRIYGMTASLPGVGWMQLGLWGVILWCGLWGAGLGYVYSRFVRSKQGNFEVAAYFAFLPIFVIAYRDGVVITVLKNSVFYLGTIAAWVAAARVMGVRDPASARRAALAPRARREGWAPWPEAAVRAARAAAAAAAVPRARRRGDATPQIVPRAWRHRDPARPAE